MEITVEVASAVSDELVEAFGRLTPQLSTTSPAPTRQHLESIVKSPACSLMIARVDGVIVGSLTLVTFPIPTGTRAWIEDVVVDSSVRGRGVGEQLNLRALEIARGKGAVTVDLTSRPSREAANRLYQRIGFHLRETNVYRHEM